MRRLLLLLALTALLIGCGGEKKESAQNNTVTDTAALRAQDQAILAEASQQLINHFQNDLRANLMKAMAEGGPVGAISVCREVAPAIADSNSVYGWSIRRVSEKYRNPDDRPTVEEKAVLAGFAPEASTPPEYVENWNTTDSVTEYRFYEPIYTQPLCLKCHGDLQTIAPGVLAAVKKNYPDDRATGYQDGQLRGMFVVEVLYPEGMAYARRLIGDTTAQVPQDSM